MNGDYLATPKNTLAARVYLATIDQYRTFGSPQGYPGTPMVPGQGTPQALAAHDYVASLNLTSSFRKTLVNEARMSFTRSTQSAHGDGTPAATSLGMTPADRFFDQPPEIVDAGSAGQLPPVRHAGQRFRHREQILLLDRQSRLDARQPQDARRRLLPDAEQRARRPRCGARQTGLPDVQRFSAGAQRRRQSESIGPQQHTVRAGQRGRRTARRGPVPLPQLLRRRLPAERLQSQFATQSELGHALGICRSGARYRGRHRQRLARTAAAGGDSAGVRHAAGQHGGGQL